MTGKAEEPRTRGPRRPDRGVTFPANLHDQEHVNQSFDIIHHGGLSEQAHLRGERWFVARLASETLNRIEEGGFFAANVGARTTSNLDIETHALAQNVVAQEAPGARGRKCVREPLARERILAPQIKVS